MKNRVLFIAGMHRSGTSLTAQWINKNGLFIGENLLSGYSDNPYGHYEDLEILSIMLENLKLNGLHENGVILKKVNELKLKCKQDFEKIRNERNLNYNVWGWKEPRSTLYLNEINEIIPELFVLAVFRHPALVIESLYKRLKKNKWYYTRNPLKKILWYIDIDLHKKKWVKIFEKAYCIYNQSIIDFHQKYPNRIYLLDIKEFQKEENNISVWLKYNIGLTISTPVSGVIDQNILNQNINNCKYGIDNALKVYSELKKASSIGK